MLHTYLNEAINCKKRKHDKTKQFVYLRTIASNNSLNKLCSGTIFLRFQNPCSSKVKSHFPQHRCRENSSLSKYNSNEVFCVNFALWKNSIFCKERMPFLSFARKPAGFRSIKLVLVSYKEETSCTVITINNNITTVFTFASWSRTS